MATSTPPPLSPLSPLSRLSGLSGHELHDPRPSGFGGSHEQALLTWRVVSFVDPHGTGSDLAFTEGLSAVGRPELLLWARPTEGLDPGADWLLTHRERSRLLNQWASELIDGRLDPGAQREVWFDGGDTVARFGAGRPVITSGLSHPFFEPGTEVMSMSWSMLRRARIGTPARATPAVVQRRLDRWIELAGKRSSDRQFAGGGPGRLDAVEHTAVPDRLRTGDLPMPDGEGGAVTRWVAARARQVLAADAGVIAGFLARLRLADQARCGDCRLDELLATAARARRHAAGREASHLAQDLALAITGPAGEPTGLWRQVGAGVWWPATAGAGQAGSDGFDDDSDDEMRTLLSDGLELVMVAAVLADLTRPAVMAAAVGPWEWAAAGQYLPGREWLARPAVRQAARELLAPASPASIAGAVSAARASAGRRDFHALDRLTGGLQSIGAASARPGTLLVREQRDGLPRSIRRTADGLARQLVTALARPDAFDAADWQLLRQRFDPFAPGLAERLPVRVP